MTQQRNHDNAVAAAFIFVRSKIALFALDGKQRPRDIASSGARENRTKTDGIIHFANSSYGNGRRHHCWCHNNSCRCIWPSFAIQTLFIFQFERNGRNKHGESRAERCSIELVRAFTTFVIVCASACVYVRFWCQTVNEAFTINNQLC